MEIAYIGMGGNLASAAGEPAATLAAAVNRLRRLGRVIGRSSLYRTAPVGYAEQPFFVNAAIALETELGPRTLLEALLGIEAEFGRDRTHAIANGPRTLDLDLLLLGDWVLQEAGLVLPHPRICGRAFVLAPLTEIAPGLVIPPEGETVAELLEAVEGRKTVERIGDAAWSASAARRDDRIDK